MFRRGGVEALVLGARIVSAWADGELRQAAEERSPRSRRFAAEAGPAIPDATCSRRTSTSATR
jgi:hypothetical protein